MSSYLGFESQAHLRKCAVYRPAAQGSVRQRRMVAKAGAAAAPHSGTGSVTASRIASAAATTAGKRAAGSSGTRTRTVLRPDS